MVTTKSQQEEGSGARTAEEAGAAGLVAHAHPALVLAVRRDGGPQLHLQWRPIG